MTNADDMGVTVMMPHTIDRELIKRIPEYGEKFAITPKDRRTTQIKPDDLEWIQFECEPTMSPFVLQLLHEKEAMLVCWKRIEGDERTPIELLTGLVRYLSDPQTGDNGANKPSILKHLMMEVPNAEYAKLMGIDEEELEKTGDVVEETNESAVENVEEANSVEPDNVEGQVDGCKATDDVTENEMAEENNDNVEVNDPNVCDDEATHQIDDEITDGDQLEIIPSDAERPDGPKEDLENETEHAKTTEVAPPPEVEVIQQCPAAQGFQNISVPPVWTPPNNRTNAAFIYLYFRQV